MAASARTLLRSALPRLLSPTCTRCLHLARTAVLPRTKFALTLPTRRYATSDASPFTRIPTDEDRAREEAAQGALLLEQGQPEEALAAYDRALGIHDSASGHYDRGVALYSCRRVDEAIAAWETSIELSPSSDAHNNLASAVLLRQPPSPEKALSHFRKAVELSPMDGQIRFNLAAVLEVLKDLEGSLDEYRKAKALGVERADQNIRNVGAKLLREMVDKPEETAS